MPLPYLFPEMVLLLQDAVGFEFREYFVLEQKNFSRFHVQRKLLERLVKMQIHTH